MIYDKRTALEKTWDAKKAARKEKLEKRLDEVEEWMFDNPYTHPDFQKYVEERNHITTTLNTIQ